MRSRRVRTVRPSAVIGGGASTAAALTTMFGLVERGWSFAVLSTPAVWSVPLAFGAGIIVSLRDDDKVADIGHKMALLHVPERVTDTTSESVTT